MHYLASDGCPLPYNPLKAIITPRPIGWISTLDENGVANLAPYSFFNAISSDPGILMFSSEQLKDSALNAKTSGEFVFSLSTLALSEAMNTTSEGVSADVDEFELSGLEKGSCLEVAAPRVAASPAALECKTLAVQQMKNLAGEAIDVHVVFGQVVAVHIDDDYITDEGRFDTAKAVPLARCGYRDFTSFDTLFELLRPDD